MLDSTPSFATVRIVFDPYNHEQVQTFLKKVYALVQSVHALIFGL